ncbi:MAG TPA: TonB family protein [Candidatus Sulfopaludibacter sp.]|nr:TonB family protein [Candidatus Sulfopaludibacter sp.]
MSAAMLWDNVVAYSLQIGLLVGLAAFVPAALRLQVPRARLLFWHLLLAACLLLPLIRPAQRTVANGKVEVTTTITAIAQAPPTPKFRLSRSEAALLLLSLGALARLAWLGIGLWRLGRYRRHSIPLEPAPAWSAEADLRLSEDVSSPVTFGFRHPVVLLPPQFPELDAAKQDAILCHEVLHVRRRDWLFTLAEELLRSVFWFHPAIWWLLGEIQLAREQAVDREVIEMTKSSDEYVDALLHMAGAHPRLDLAPAPLFLRKRHLKQRVVWILKEVRMSKTRWISTLAVAMGMLAAACWFVTGAFPLAAAPQTVADAPGVTVDTNGATLMHRPSVSYPPDALRNSIQGTVVLQVKLDAKGEVSDVNVLSGPDELRRSAIQSVLTWHFAKDAALGTRQVSIAFQLPKQEAAAAVTAAPGAVVGGVPGGMAGGVVGGVPGGVRSGVIGGVIGSVPVARQQVGRPMEGTVNRIVISGLSDQARSELQSRLPVREGDAFSQDVFNKVRDTVREFDDHLAVGIGTSDNGLQLMITAPGSRAVITNSSAPSFTAPPGTIRVGGNMQQAKLVSQGRPVYPPLAKQARIQGTVTLNALIGPDGHIQNLAVVHGHPLLVQAALDAVKDWVYEPTLLNGQPVAVVTTIDVNFTLSE